MKHPFRAATLLRTHLLGALLFGVALPLVAQDGPPVRLPQATATTAMEQSLALENRGDFAGAKQLLLEAFGANPATYDVAVRLAWLTLRQNKGGEATELYRRARTMPGSLPEATTGLGLALTTLGYNRLERGALGEARDAWTEALVIDATNAEARNGIALLGGPPGVSAEVWYAMLHAEVASSRAQVYYGQLPVRLDNSSAVRIAVRGVTSPTFSGTSGAFAQQTEFYGAISHEVGISTIEGIGFVFSGAGRTNSGGALSVRVGGNYGIVGTASLIARTGANNIQIAPSAFVWLTPNVALSGGVRVTSDSSFSSVSPMASATVRFDQLTLDLSGHFGKEQWAFTAAGPTILSFLDQTTGGATATVSRNFGHGVTAFGQLQFEQTAASGSFQSIGIGARFAPR